MSAIRNIKPKLLPVVLLLFIALVFGILWPLIATAEATPHIEASYLEDSSTTEIALVAESPFPTPKELVVIAFPDAPVMVRIASAESSFIPTASNPNSTALGLFQILKGTWNSYECTGMETNAVDNISCAKKIYQIEGTTPWNSSKDEWDILH